MSEIFSIEINEEGKYWLQRFSRLSLLILVITIFVSGVNLYKTVPYVLDANKVKYLTSHQRMTNHIFLAYLILNFVLQIAQVIFYRRFAFRCEVAMERSNSIGFNHSYKWLFYQSICFLAQIIFTFAYFVYVYYGIRS